MAQAPNINNYFIGKGIVSWQPLGVGPFIDLGNCPKFEFTPKPETKKHYSSRTPIRAVDQFVQLTKEASLAFGLDEINPQTLALATSGSITTDTAGNVVIGIMDVPLLRGAVKLVGTQTYGNKFTATFFNVVFYSNKPLAFIGDDYMTADLEAEVLFSAVNNAFGHFEQTLDSGTV